MRYYNLYKRTELFLVLSKSVLDFGIFYEYRPPSGIQQIKHQFRVGLPFIRLYVSWRDNTR